MPKYQQKPKREQSVFDKRTKPKTRREKHLIKKYKKLNTI